MLECQTKYGRHLFDQSGRIMNGSDRDQRKKVEETIQNCVNDSSWNSLRDLANNKAWAAPLIGFSKGDDPLYLKFKEVVGPYHWTPLEIFQLTFPEEAATAEELTVISWILPQTEETKAANRLATHPPSEKWARSRIFGEEFNVKLRSHLVSSLKESGIASVAPLLSPLWGRRTSERFVFSSTWSERHAAFASGLGTFGLCDGLITPRGKAMRCGSVVARVVIPPTERPYQNHQAYCLFYAKGTCKKCIGRCPAGAISEAGHDKRKCYDYMHPMTDEFVQSHFGFKGYGCGLCQTGVPCESRNPVRS
jgi:epoxyqueuosine reductase